MATYFPAKINTAFEFYASLVSQANTKINQVSPTLAAGDVKVSTDNGASANITTLPVIGTNTKTVKVNLSAAEMNGGNVAVIFSDAAGAEWCDLTVNIQTAARQIDDLSYPTVTGRSLDVSATGEAGVDWANVGSPGTTVSLSATTVATVTTATTATNVTTVNGLAANVITAASMAADASTEIRSIASGTSDSGTTTTMVDAARTEADTDYWRGQKIMFTSGTLSGQTKLITGFNPATDTITFTPATTVAAGTHTYEILPGSDVILGQLTHTSAVIPTVSAVTGLTASNLDATVSSRMATYTQPTGFLASTFPTTVASTTNITAATGVVLSGVTHTGAVIPTVSAVTGLTAATVHSDLDDIQARLPAALVGGKMDSNASAIDGNAAAAANLKQSTLGIVTAVVGSGSTTTSIVTSSMSPAAAVADQFKGKIVTFSEDTTTANLRGQSTDITANTALGVLTVTALTTAAVSGDTFSVT